MFNLPLHNLSPQGLKVRPFVGLIPQHSKSVEEDVTSSEVPSKNTTTLSLEDISPVVPAQGLLSSDDLALRSTNSVIRSPVASEDVCVQIPRGAAPGSKISVPGPHGVISITVPDDYKPDELYIVRVSSN